MAEGFIVGIIILSEQNQTRLTRLTRNYFQNRSLSLSLLFQRERRPKTQRLCFRASQAQMSKPILHVASVKQQLECHLNLNRKSSTAFGEDIHSKMLVARYRTEILSCSDNEQSLQVFEVFPLRVDHSRRFLYVNRRNELQNLVSAQN